MPKSVMRRAAALLAAVGLAAIAVVTDLGSVRAAPGLTITQTRLGNVFLEPEAPGFIISTTAPAISWSVLDVWNKEVASGSAPVSGGSYRLSPSLPAKGWFHLAVRAQGGGQQETSFALLSSIPPVADSPFGISAHIGQANPVQTFPLLTAAGIKAVRTDIYWSAVERSPGAYDFSYYDQYLPAMRQQTGAFAALTLAYNNVLYDGNLNLYSTAGLTAWGRFAAAAARHYRGLARWVQIFNEYDNSAGNGPCSASPTCYAQLLQYSYPAVKAANPDMTVIGGGVVGVNLPWLEKLFQAGGLKYMDVVSVLASAPPAPEGVEDKLAALDALIRKYNGGNPKPIHVAELGWTTSRSVISVDETAQARYLVRGQVLAQSAPSVERTFVYCFINDQLEQPDWAKGFGSLHNLADIDGAYTPKPGYVTNAVMHRALAGASYIGRTSAPSGVRSYLYSNGVQVMWAPTPATVTLHTTGPVTATDEMGNATSYPSQNGLVTLSLTGDPVYVAGSVQSIT